MHYRRGLLRGGGCGWLGEAAAGGAEAEARRQEREGANGRVVGEATRAMVARVSRCLFISRGESNVRLRCASRDNRTAVSRRADDAKEIDEPMNGGRLKALRSAPTRPRMLVLDVSPSLPHGAVQPRTVK